MPATQSTVIINTNATFTFTDGWDIYTLDASSSNITITLPDISQNDGYSVNLYRRDTTTNTVTIMGFNGSQTINGNTSIGMATQTSLTLISLGAVWYKQRATTKATHKLLDIQVLANTTSFTSVGFFPWNSALYSAYTNGTLTVYSTIATTNLIVQIIDGIALTVLGGPITISTSGVTIIPFTLPSSSSTFLALQVEKSSSSVPSPIVSGATIEFST